jgi:DnaK suppressor protein
MDAQHYRELLLKRESELTQEIARLDEEGRNSRAAEVEDPIDTVTSDESKSANFQLADVAVRTLQQVRAAFQAIEDGSYGFCLDCGRAIEPARLEAVPWARYCREDQEKHDRLAAAGEDAGVIPTA